MKNVTAKLSGRSTFNLLSPTEWDEELKPFNIKCPDELVLSLTDSFIERIVAAKEIADEYKFSSISLYSENMRQRKIMKSSSSIQPMRDGALVEPSKYLLYDDKYWPVFETDFFKVIVPSTFSHGDFIFVHFIISNDGANCEIILDYEFLLEDMLD